MGGKEYSIRDFDIDSKLAEWFYKFLKGEVKELPEYNILDNVANKSPIDDVISSGHGMSINKINGEISITYTEPISDNIYRIDVIKGNKYTAYTANDKGMQDIDPIIMPMFSEEKIKELQQYLTEYKNKDYEVGDEGINKKASSL